MTWKSSQLIWHDDGTQVAEKPSMGEKAANGNAARTLSIPLCDARSKELQQ